MVLFVLYLKKKSVYDCFLYEQHSHTVLQILSYTEKSVALLFKKV